MDYFKRFGPVRLKQLILTEIFLCSHASTQIDLVCLNMFKIFFSGTYSFTEAIVDSLVVTSHVDHIPAGQNVVS